MSQKNFVTRSLFAIVTTVLTIQSVFAAITIETSPAPGIYHAPVKVTLTPSDPAAKIYYSFNPDGGPNDALAYTGPILIKSSTPLVYFGFVTMDNESKVLIDDYIIDYPSTIAFWSDITRENGKLKNVTLKNTGTGEIDLSYWEIRTQDTTITIPENTVVAANSSYTVGDINVANGQSILLASPDGDTKDILVLDEVANTIIKKEVPKPIIKKVFKATVVRELPAEIWIKPRLAENEKPQTVSNEVVTSEKPQELPSTASAAIIETNTPTTPEIIPAPQTDVVSPIPEAISPQPETSLADNLKISASEKTSSSPYAPWIILWTAVLAGGIMGTRLMLRKKK